MRLLLSLTFTLSVATSCSPDSGNSLPDAVRAAFDNAAEFDLHSLDPNPREGESKGPPAPAPLLLQGWVVLGKTTLKGRTAIKAREAIDSGRRESDGTVAGCFEPRHAVRIVHGSKTYDLVICYACLRAQIYEGTERIGAFTTSRSPSGILNTLLVDAGIPLPKQ